MNRTILTLKEAAEMLRASESTLRYWRHLGVGPRSFKLGRRVVYAREDLDRWVHDNYDAAHGHGIG
ncbi:helix-turn-helix transcriptional regulator [Georgenia sp. AZ-5]|uniref:helix-turn-helix transcriptional regulator n=1 Tax=Georgenia sp. AZ-5 TaxID=3367526 RepID=UPI0037540C59